MPKTNSYPQLKAALEKFLARGKKTTVASNMSQEIHENWQRYAPKGLNDVQKGISPNTILNVAASEKGYATKRVADVLFNYLRRHATSAPEAPLKPISLDLLAFFGTTDIKRNKVAEQIKGRYQTYARSTTRPGKIRRGLLEFIWDERSKLIRVREVHVRPPDDRSPTETRAEWEGFAAPRGDRIFCVMRRPHDREDATPLFYIFQLVETHATTGHVTKLDGVSLNVNEERLHMIDTVTSIAYRQDLSKIKLDFIDDFDLKIPKEDILRINPNGKV